MTFFKLLAAAGLSALLAGPALAQERISIGTGGTGGLFCVIGAGMADVLNQKMPGTTARAEVTGASVENIRRVAAAQMTFGFSSSSTPYEASAGDRKSGRADKGVYDRLALGGRRIFKKKKTKR